MIRFCVYARGLRKAFREDEREAAVAFGRAWAKANPGEACFVTEREESDGPRGATQCDDAPTERQLWHSRQENPDHVAPPVAPRSSYQQLEPSGYEEL